MLTLAKIDLDSRIPPLNFFLASGWKQRQNCMLSEWSCERVCFRFILLLFFVVFASVEQGKGSLVVCWARHVHMCIEPKGKGGGFIKKNVTDADTSSHGISHGAVGRPFSWSNMRDTCDDIDQISLRHEDPITLSSDFCNKFLQAMELAHQPYPCECKDHIWEKCGASPAQSKPCHKQVTLWSWRFPEELETADSRTEFLRLLLAHAGVQAGALFN